MSDQVIKYPDFELVKVIGNACLRHQDSGEASVSKAARVILMDLEKAGYEVVKKFVPRKTIPENKMFTIRGETFYCPECGCNVFRTFEDNAHEHQCNSCNAIFSSADIKEPETKKADYQQDEWPETNKDK